VNRRVIESRQRQRLDPADHQAVNSIPHCDRSGNRKSPAASFCGPPANTTAITVLAGTRIQERTRSTKSELAEHSQQRPTKNGVHLGGSTGGSSWQTRVAQCVQLDTGWIKVKAKPRFAFRRNSRCSVYAGQLASVTYCQCWQ